VSSKKRKIQDSQHTHLKQNHLSAKTPKQKDYIKSVKDNQVVICLGPAGTGKTHIATSLAIMGLVRGDYEKVIITRPLVQAGEDTGYLPGSIREKMSPYLRPIFDELLCYVSNADIATMMNSGQIEICPLAYMRGRNFHHSFIVADECQNASEKQLMMLLTRIGKGSKMVMTGDASQSDLNHRSQGGLQDCEQALEGVDGIGIVRLGTEDIVREPIVEKIVKAMEKYHSSSD
jgi:phosphate starvation-inducible PhoH-like protein